MGVCEVRKNSGLSFIGKDEGIGIALFEGDIWLYKQDEKHQDRIKVLHGSDICISIKGEKFCELFRVVK